MKSRELYARAARVLDRLDQRAEQQTFLAAADYPASVCTIDEFHELAGAFERRQLRFANDLPVANLARSLRRLRAQLCVHALLCFMEAQRRRLAALTPLA